MTHVETRLQSDLAEATGTDPFASRWASYLAAVAMTVLATIVAVAVDSKVSIPNLSLIFVIPVIIAGVGLGLGPSLCSAILGALAFNFFLTEPRYSLAVDDAANIWAIALLFVVGLIVSGVAFTSRRRAEEAALLRKQATILENYSQDIVAARDEASIASITSRALKSILRVPAVVMLVREGKLVCVKRNTDAEPEETEFEAARSSLATGTILRGGVYPHLASRFDFWPVRTAEGRGAVVGLAFDPDERPSTPDTYVRVVAGLFGFALERVRRQGATQ